MVIFFNVGTVKQQLLTGGSVYTIRKRRRSGHDVAVTGNMYHYTVFADVDVTEVTAIVGEWQLIPYVPYSGLKSAEEWLRLARQLHGTTEALYLYRVTLTKRRGLI